MASTAHFNITLVEQNQSQKEVTVNEAITKIDGLLSSAVIEKDTGEFWKKNSIEVNQAGLSGTSVISALQIPDRALVFGVHCRVTSAITGATDFSVGIAGETGLFGAGISIATDSTNIGIIAPRPFFADTDVTLTPNGGNFTGGDINLILHYMTFRGGWDF